MASTTTIANYLSDNSLSRHVLSSGIRPSGGCRIGCKQPHRWLLAALASILVLAPACQPAPPAVPADSNPAAGATGSASAQVPRAGGRLIVADVVDAKVLNPVLTTDNASNTVSSRIHESLITINAKTAAPEPRLAERFEVSPDQKTLTFVLRDGLRWSDGTAFSGEDFTFTAEAVMRSAKTQRKSYFQQIVGAKDFRDGKSNTISGIQVNGHTITVELEQAFCPALTQIGGFGIISKNVFGKYVDPADPRKNIDDAPENTAPPVAMGPYKFQEWQPNNFVLLTRNDSFFLTKPLLDEWVWKVYPDSTVGAAALKTGEVDALRLGDTQQLEDLKQVASLSFHSFFGNSYTFIGWNQLRGGKEYLQSKTLRQALAYGLNMDQVTQTLYAGEGVRMVGHISPASWAYNPVVLNEYPYDPQKAQTLIEQDGWRRGSDGIYEKDGQKLELTMVTQAGNKVREGLGQVAAEQYRRLGINAKVQPEPFEALVDRLNKSRDPKYGEQGGRDFDAVIVGWSLDSDPDPFSIWHSSQMPQPGLNVVGYRNEAVDRAVEEGRTQCGLDQRKASYNTVNKQLNEDQPYNFGVANKHLVFVNRRFQNVDPGPFGGPGTQGGERYLWNVESWWIKE